MSEQQSRFFEKLNQRSGRPKTALPSTPIAKRQGSSAAVTQQSLPGMEQSAVESKPKRNRRQSGDPDGYGEIVEIHYQRTLDSLNQADRERFQRLTGG